MLGITIGGSMDRLPTALSALITVACITACAPGALGGEAADQQSSTAPTTSSATPSVSAPAPPAPTATPLESQRFDGIDLASALIPLTQTEAAAALGGVWQTVPRDEIVVGLSSATFADSPTCASAVAVATELVPLEVIGGGYSYGEPLTPSVIAARMSSPAAASGWVTAVTDASVACDGVTGQPAEAGSLAHIRTLIEGAPAVQGAGMSGAGFGYDGQQHITTYVIASHEELVLVMLDEPAVEGWDTPIVAHMQNQFAAFEAAAG